MIAKTHFAVKVLRFSLFISFIEVLYCSPFQVVQSCISCLGAVVNKVTHNIRLVKDYFQKYHGKFIIKANKKITHSWKVMKRVWTKKFNRNKL